METLKKYFTKECLRRTARTFVQTACGYVVTNIATVCAGIDFTDVDTLTNVLVGLGISAVSAGIAAIMNLKEE